MTDDERRLLLDTAYLLMLTIKKLHTTVYAGDSHRELYELQSALERLRAVGERVEDTATDRRAA